MLTKYTEFEVLAVERASGEVVHEAERIAAASPFVKQAHRAHFDYERRPGFIYVRSRAISSRTNDNYDQFPAPEIKKAWATFIGKPVFVNHHNANHRRARGFIIDAALHEDTNPDGSPDTWVEVLMEVDAVRFPRLAEACVKGDIARTSMGTDVTHSICTACGNKAVTPQDYCIHIPAMKGQKVFRFNAALGKREQVLVAEVCYGLGFFENSLLVEPPADPTAFVLGVDGLNVTAAQHMASIIEEQPQGPWPDWERPVTKTASLSKTADKYDDMDSTDLWLEVTNRGLEDVDHGYGPQADAHNRALLRADDDPANWSPRDRDSDHQPVSEAGWNCDICGYPVNGQTFNGYPAEGDSVRHTSMRKTADEDQCPYCSDDSLTTPLGYICGQGHIWGDTDPAALAYHGDGPQSGVLQPLSTSALLDEAERLWVESAVFGDGQAVKSVSELQPGHNVTMRDNRIGAGFGSPMHVEKAGGGSVTLRDHRTGFTQQVHDRDLDDVNGISLQHHMGHMPSAHPVPHHHQMAAAADAMRSLGYGETKAPAQVDTLRIDRCPVCKDEDGFNGEKCSVCGHVEPPEHFRDPDLSKAQQVDLRQDQNDAKGKGTSVDKDGNPVDPNADASISGAPNDHAEQDDLQCSNCGEVFSAEGQQPTDPKDPNADPKAQADGDVPGDTSDGKIPAADPSLDDMADKSDADLGLEGEEDSEDPEDSAEDSDVVGDAGEQDEDADVDVTAIDPNTGEPVAAKPVQVDPSDPQAKDPAKPTTPPSDPNQPQPSDPSKQPPKKQPDPVDQSQKVDETGVVQNATPNPATTTPEQQPVQTGPVPDGAPGSTSAPLADPDVVPNQTCPICGEGTLVPVATAQTGIAQQDVDDQQVVDQPSKENK